ncbi:CHAT domain-containing protein, partial [Actinophytocola sediminis]
HTGRRADLDEAIAALRAAASAVLRSAPARPAILSKLGVALRGRFEHTGRAGDLDDAVAACREAVAGIAEDYPGRPGYLVNLSATLRVRFVHTGRRADLDEAIVTGRTAVAAAGAGHPDHFVCRSVLGLALQERYTSRGDPADLEYVIAAFTEAVATVPADAPNYPPYHFNLGRALLARFQRASRPADLDGGVAAVQAAVAAIAPDRPHRVGYLSLLGEALVTRFAHAGDLDDLTEGIAAHRQAVAGTPTDHADYALRLSTLGIALLTRFRRTGELGDLDEAVAGVREAVNATATTHPDHAEHADTLGDALRTRFEHTGRPADLEQAVAAGRQAVAGTPPEHVRYHQRLSNLSAALRGRFQRTGAVADLDDALTAVRDALAAVPADHADHLPVSDDLRSALVDRYLHTRGLADIDEAVAIGHAAVAGATRDDPRRPHYLHGLSVALRTRFGRTGKDADLTEAMATVRDAVAGVPADHPDRAAALVQLSSVLHDRFRRTGDAAELTEAITAVRDAIATTPPAHPHLADRLVMLGRALRTRFDHTGERTDLERARAAFADAVTVESSPTEVRMAAADSLARVAIKTGDVGAAADGFAAAVRLLPHYLWPGLPDAIREHRVAGWRGLAADAAACAIRAGRAEQAVELLDAGRSVLWAQLLDRRAELTELRAREPALAVRLDELRGTLDAPLPTTRGPIACADQHEWARAGQHDVAVGRVRLADEFAALVERVRGLAGFAHFLAPTPFAELRAAPGTGQVAIVNVSRYGCHALLVSDTGVRVVDLPGLTREQAVDQANTLQGLVTGGTERDRDTMSDILAWLWDAVAEPVLTGLGHTEPPAPGAAWPRIWWCPTGRLALLPLHAAGRQTIEAGDTVPDRVISSYTPTLTALARARSTPPPAARPTLLAIGTPAELDRVHARYPIATRADPPTGARVLAELPRHDWVHFACHGRQDLSDPAASALLLTDGALPVGDLVQDDGRAPRLAFLSACQTATGGARAVDEAVTLAASLRFLGYRDVIATLWSSVDAPSPEVADEVYALLAAGIEATGTADVATALHHAVASLRARTPADPLVWAAYLHTGP